jgi:GGDEF domain-containing protein
VEISEIVVWCAMLGGLLTLAVMASFDAAVSRNAGALRNLAFIVVAGTTCVLMSGLPEVLWPGIPASVLMLAKISLVPLSGAIALNYLGIWLGGMREDVIVFRITAWGGRVLFYWALALTLMAAASPDRYFQRLLAVAAFVNMTAILLGLAAAIRAAALGDRLARWMVLACLCLATMASGLYLRGLNIEGFGLVTWICTATLTVGYFLIATVLVVMRNREARHLRRLAGLEVGADPATGLPTGSVLLSEVEHAFWRTARRAGSCTVVCLHLGNLYELAEAAGHGVENQILAAMAARIRRAAGFRCVVGLYHPRCFVVVISADKRRQYVNLTISRLRTLVAQPLSVIGRDQAQHDFSPQLGVGVVVLDPANADPLDAINKAERLAVAPDNPSGYAEEVMDSDLEDTTPSTLEDTTPAALSARSTAGRKAT